MVLVAGVCLVSHTASVEAADQQVSDDTQATSGSAIDTMPPNATLPPIDTTQIKLNKAKSTSMVGKNVTLKVSGTTQAITWSSRDTSIATVSEKGVLKGVKKGKTVVEARVEGMDGMLECQVTIVDKMSKKDFGKFSGENFVGFCERKGYNKGNRWAWNGKWKISKKKYKKGTTYRKVKIDSSKSAVQNAYGDLTWKKCSSKDPFTKIKGLKKNKVKTYADVTYGKYRIRFYLNKNKKVVAIIFAHNIGKIKKKDLKKYF